MTKTLATTKTLIVGLGSPYGDDQVGWMACERLKMEIGHLPAMKFVICDRSGIEWMTKLSSAGQVIFIDAMRSGKKPGTVRKIDLSTAEWSEYPARLSSHGINIKDAIDVAQSLGELPEIISAWGIELEQCNYESGLSESVKTALPTLLANIKSGLILT
ncbi:MAG: hydrogenase maturation protease [Gammaproteobacteria bacterium]|nr:hydrogenase maturation protease [Gammaproteobacteria bacterium]